MTLGRQHILLGIDLFGVGDHPVHFQREPLLAAVGVDRGVRRDLGAIDRYGPEPAKPARPAIMSTCVNSEMNPSAVRAEPGQGAVVRDVLGTQHPERDVGAA